MAAQLCDANSLMQRAICLAEKGEGAVEPNPMVGAVLVDENGQILAEGFHEYFGGLHAEASAIQAACHSGKQAQLKNASLYVTLEPCAHRGKTAPCTTAIIEAGIRKVIIGCKDPAIHSSKKGIDLLKQAGIEVQSGVLHEQCKKLIRPFTKLITTQTPYVHAKWAMTLDGKIASRTGSSRWISNPQSRKVVHKLRARMDAIIVGVGTVLADDPLLTARPPSSRELMRIVLDSNASIPLDSQLVQSARKFPLVVACCKTGNKEKYTKLEDAGIQVMRCPENVDQRVSISYILAELGKISLTNVLVEGGAEVLGTFFDLNLVDEVHTFIAPKIIGGADSVSPVAGKGIAEMQNALQLQEFKTRTLDDNIYLNGDLNDEDQTNEQ